MPHAAGRLLSTYNYGTKRQIGAVGQNRIDSRFIKIDSDPILSDTDTKSPAHDLARRHPDGKLVIAEELESPTLRLGT